jgi:hypothetical protein
MDAGFPVHSLFAQLLTQLLEAICPMLDFKVVFPFNMT